MGDFENICKEIKEVKIQGAENIAKAALIALSYRQDKEAVKILISLRPTEPALRNTINYALKEGVKKALDYFKEADKKMIENGASLIKNKDNVYTHCHSTSVSKIFQKAKEKKNFVVYNTETRPLFQGRLTSQDLAKYKIKNIHMVDSAMKIALKKCNLVLIGADAITKKEVINKVGSELVADIAEQLKIPLYVCAVSWKFDKTQTKIEERDAKEVWKDAPEGVRVMNPAFEAIPLEKIKGIVSELGILSPKDFLKKVRI